MIFEGSLAAPPAQKSGWARFRLRDATAADHARVDRAFSAFDLLRPAGYSAFLQTQYACLEPLEHALTAAGAAQLLGDWPRRRRAELLLADLTDLGAEGPSRPSPLDIDLAGVGARLGALYVLEGSRFGGAVIARNLPAGSPARFLRAEGPPQAWRSLVEALDRHLTPDRELRAAETAARAVFAAFEAAARHPLEVGVG